MMVWYYVIEHTNHLMFDRVANMSRPIERVFHYNADPISSPFHMNGKIGCKSHSGKIEWAIEINADLINDPNTL